VSYPSIIRCRATAILAQVTANSRRTVVHTEQAAFPCHITTFDHDKTLFTAANPLFDDLDSFLARPMPFPKASAGSQGPTGLVSRRTRRRLAAGRCR
jgi:hypothetical protein